MSTARWAARLYRWGGWALVFWVLKVRADAWLARQLETLRRHWYGEDA